jgi:hypothetical protein
MPNSIDDFEEKVDQKLERRMSSRNRSFFYISGSASDNKSRMRAFLLGPYPDYETANRIAESKRLTSFEIFENSSSDLGKVSQILKAQRLHRGTSIADVFDKLKHKRVGQEVQENTI